MSLNFIVLLLLNAQNEVLLVRRINTPFCNGCYALPSCSINSGETATHAALREAKNTFGIELTSDALACTLVMHRKCNEAEFFMCVFQVAAVPSKATNHDGVRYDDMQWFELDALPTTMVPAHRYAIACIQNNITYAEHGWSERCSNTTHTTNQGT